MKPMREDLMVQQQVKSKWQHMVAVICLNQTYRKQVKECLPLLFSKYPTPEKMIKADIRSIQRIIKPLGMWKVRSKRIKQMSKEYLTWDQKDAADLHGIGKYGSDSYKIFYQNKTNIRVQDKELKKYLKENKMKKSKSQIRKEKLESKYGQFDPEIHTMSKQGIGFHMKKDYKEKPGESSGSQLKQMFDRWTGNDKVRKHNR